MPAFLKELNGENAFELGDFALIGRNDGATIRLLDTSISRQHASIRREDRDFWIVQIYASRNNWQTWWANVQVAPGEKPVGAEVI